ncbi:uncharacterized protein LOC125659154 isoform X2 [Ostrea edulis]|uniref:uncharacterized protein LOC125659154 isoform X2 n=1 Tax=Ostrea edulis TaxID=37623 RepID=UPI0020943348|nr:uncharacterized protein LOC125659154 isoform X2 [Ostrea edulis]
MTCRRFKYQAPKMKFQIAIVACFMTVCLQNAMAQVYGGGTCAFSTSGVAACTSTANGFCALDTIVVTGSPVTAVTTTGKCVCYAGYSGTLCGTYTSTTTASTNNALGVLAVGALAAYFLSGAGNAGSSTGLGGNGDLTGTDLLYLQQAQQIQG